MANPKKKGLGRGLGALITPGALADPLSEKPSSAKLADGSELIALDPRVIEPNPKQPRRVFDENALHELAESIKRDGVQEPVIVRRAGKNFELVSGERRVRASILADLPVIPAVCRPVSDRDMLKLGIIENIQREDLNAIELAQAYAQLLSEFRWTQEELAAEVGKNRVTVTNTLRLLNLPTLVQGYISDGSLSMGHAKALLAIESPDGQCAAARKIISQGLSVRQAEKLGAATKQRPPAAAPKRNPHITALEDELRRRFGTRVALKSQENGKGKIEIEYFSLDELERLLDLLRGGR